MSVSFSSLVIVVAAGFLAPFLLGFVPALRLPAIVLEILFGILLGPDVLGWVEVDTAISVIALVGLSFLLFLAGLEIDVRRLRGPAARRAGLAYLVSLAAALAVGLVLTGVGLVDAPLLTAVILATTGLGIVVPVLKDSGEALTPFGRLVIVGAAIAELASIVLLTLLFSREAAGTGAKVILLGGFAAVVLAVALVIVGAEHSRRVGRVLERLQDTTAQIRVRGAFLLVVGFVAVAGALGLEAILGAFLAGVILSALDRDRGLTHPRFREKLEAAGFGIFIPVFFVTSGLRFDLDALLGSASALAMVPIFLIAMLVVRGAPALLYRPLVGTCRALAGGLLQATTSVGFVVVAVDIGMATDVIGQATGAALVSAGLISVLVFPLAGLSLLGGAPMPAVTTSAGTAAAGRDGLRR